MKTKTIFPFLPIPYEKAVKFSSMFRPVSRKFLSLNKKVRKDLSQADIEIEPVNYIAVSILSSIILSLIVFLPLLLFGTTVKPISEMFPLAVLFSVIFGMANFMYSLVYPKLLIKTKTQLLERDLVFALRYILLKIKSGVPLYDAMVSVAEGNYGEVSKEFKVTIKQISGGVEEVKAIEDMALRSPSQFFRRTVWQIANNLRTGSDIADVLEDITSTLSKEQKIMVRKYGSELNPLILMYMMFTIIIPSLSVVVVVIMSSFAGIKVPVFTFYLLPVFVLFLQVMFLSAIKARRPLISL